MHGAKLIAITHSTELCSPTASAFLPMANGEAQHAKTHRPILPKQPNGPCFHAISSNFVSEASQKSTTTTAKYK